MAEYTSELDDKRKALILSGNLTDTVANSDEEDKELIFGSGFGGISDMDIGRTATCTFYHLVMMPFIKYHQK